MKVLITGSAGFIGFHTANKFLQLGYEVVGLDNINDYYSTQLKYFRLQEAGIAQENIKWHQIVVSSYNKNYRFIRMHLEDKQQLFRLFQSEKFDFVINLAAQAGVRYSIENPDVYMQSNIMGFYNMLEACRYYNPKHLVHASSSSIYGANTNIPFSEEDKVDRPVSLYAATKKSNELLSYSYSELYDIPITCLRFFTVYGPWGRPDMAPMLFAKAILEEKEINVFNNGEMERDFTYIEDIVNGILKSTLTAFNESPQYRVLNLGNGSPVKLLDFIEELEIILDKPAKKRYLPMQLGDVPKTWSNQSKFQEVINYTPIYSIQEGVKCFGEWYLDYFNTKSSEITFKL